MKPFPSNAVDISSDLVRLNTVTGTAQETAALHSVASLLSDSGNFKEVWSQDGTAVVVAPRDISEPALLFSGHVDTVSFGSAGWDFNPLSGAVENGLLLGRGASDMKGGIGAQVAAMLQAGDNSPVALALSTKEEWGCAGTCTVIEALHASGLEVGAIIVAEPTDGLLLLGHKGPLWLDVKVNGVAAHGSTPGRGVNAIMQASQLLLRAQDHLPLRSHPQLGDETMNVGVISGGSMRNIVPDHAEIQIDLRTVDADERELVEWFEKQPEVQSVHIAAHHAPVWTSPENKWVRNLPLQPELTPAGYGTEVGPLSRALDSVPAVVWGPGSRGQMHVVNEVCSTSAIEKAAVGYLQAIEAWRSTLSAPQQTP